MSNSPINDGVGPPPAPGEMSALSDKVGFGQPPVKNRWSKGKSGNPKGRPKIPPRAFSVRQLGTDILRAADRKISIRDANGRRTKLSQYESLIQALYVKAHKGDIRATRLIFDLTHWAATRRERDSSEDYEFLEEMENLYTWDRSENFSDGYFLNITRLLSKRG